MRSRPRGAAPSRSCDAGVRPLRYGVYQHVAYGRRYQDVYGYSVQYQEVYRYRVWYDDVGRYGIYYEEVRSYDVRY